MRSFILLGLVLALAGCMGGEGTGTLHLRVTDAPDNIGDFAFLNVTVEKIVLHGKDQKESEAGKSEHAPASGTFDLTKLTGGNVTTIFADEVAAGDYGKLTLHVRNATGVLVNGTTVDVKAPSGRLFVTTDFTVAEGAQTDFLFDIHVKLKGDGTYQLEPNATGSGPGKTKPDADAQDRAGKDK